MAVLVVCTFRRKANTTSFVAIRPTRYLYMLALAAMKSIIINIQAAPTAPGCDIRFHAVRDVAVVVCVSHCRQLWLIGFGCFECPQPVV